MPVGVQGGSRGTAGKTNVGAATGMQRRILWEKVEFWTR